jgi:hypothetical protein
LIKQFWTLISLTLLLSLCTGAAAQSWVKVGAADRKISLYLDTNSVRNLDGGVTVSVSVLNYSRATGEEESLLAGTLHDCKLNRKRDQFVRKALLHWGTGKLLDVSGEEMDWRPVKKGSMGETLHRAVCGVRVNGLKG